MVAACVVAVIACLARDGAADVPRRDAVRELHVVGLYEGVTKTGNEIHGGRATVTVDRPGKRVTLILSAYSTVTWEVKPKPGTTLEKVILGGYEPQVIKNLPSGVQAVVAFRESGAMPSLSYFGYQVESSRFRAFVDQRPQWSDLEISSFHGTYRYLHESPILVDSVSSDPRLLRGYPKITPLAELPDLRFRAVHMALTDKRPANEETSYGDFTLGGPQAETLKPLPKGVQRLAFDEVNKRYYGISRHDAVEVDLANLKVNKMDVGFNVPRLSWPADVTFDGKRSRLLLVSSGGGGYLYSYDVKTGAWSVLAEKLGVASIVYHPKHDCLYGMTVRFSEDTGKPALRQFNSNGALVQETTLGDPIVPGSLSTGPGTNGTQLVAVDDYVVAIAAPQGLRSSSDRAVMKTFIYLIEPRTAKVWVTWKHPE